MPVSRTDEELAAAARTGDEVAYSALVHRLLRPAFAVAWEFTEDPDEAEDVVQEAFHRMVRALVHYDETRRLRPWFFSILRNVARNRVAWAKRWTLEEIDDTFPDSPEGPLQALERREIRERIEAGVDSLSPMQRACFRLIDLEGMTQSEVAEALEVAEGTVRVHLHRARRALRRFLKPVRDGSSRE
jgi:RNA polymerase sigma-70 factor (ECF subfamily)